MRPLLRKITTWLLAVVVGGIAVAVFSEWFIEVARDKGLFQNAGGRWDYAMGIIADWASSGWTLYPVTALAGYVAGLWTDKWIRMRDPESAPERHGQSSRPFNAPLAPSTQTYTRSKGRIRHNIHIHGGSLLVGHKDKQFRLRFSPGGSTAVHVYRDQLTYLARIRGKQKGDRMRASDYPNSPSFALETGERFFARNGLGQMIQGRLIEVKNDRGGHEYNEVIFDFLISEDAPEFTAI